MICVCNRRVIKLLGITIPSTSRNTKNGFQLGLSRIRVSNADIIESIQCQLIDKPRITTVDRPTRDVSAEYSPSNVISRVR